MAGLAAVGEFNGLPGVLEIPWSPLQHARIFPDHRLRLMGAELPP
jgi:hypothetical protein